jgi:hypothetical protein
VERGDDLDLELAPAWQLHDDLNPPVMPDSKHYPVAMPGSTKVL